MKSSFRDSNDDAIESHPDPPTLPSKVQPRYDVNTLNSSVSSFSERASSQHGSAISTARTSASSTVTEATASTNSPSSCCVQDTAASVGRAEMNEALKFCENPHNCEITLFTLRDNAPHLINPIARRPRIKTTIRKCSYSIASTQLPKKRISKASHTRSCPLFSPFSTNLVQRAFW